MKQLFFAALENICVLRIRERFLDGRGDRLAVEFLQLGFVIECVHMRWAADHVEKDYRLGAWAKMRQARLERIHRIDRYCRFSRSRLIGQRTERKRSKSSAEARKKIAARAVRTGSKERHGCGIGR